MRSPEEILHDVKALAIEYDAATGKPLGVTGEIAEVEAARLLGLHLAEARAGLRCPRSGTDPAAPHPDQGTAHRPRRQLGPHARNQHCT